MPKVTYNCEDGRKIDAEVDIGLDLMRAALYNEVPGILGECTGGLACATCKIFIPEDWQILLPEATAAEQELLGYCDLYPPHARLACQVVVTPELDGIVVNVPQSQD